MPNYRRAHVPGGTFFFTVVTHRRRPIFEDVVYRSLFGDSTRECQHDCPFEINAIVLLPDHLHAIWTLPPGDTNYSGRWSVIKGSFTKKFLAAGGVELGLSKGKRKEAAAGSGRGDTGNIQSKTRMTSRPTSITSTIIQYVGCVKTHLVPF